MSWQLLSFDNVFEDVTKHFVKIPTDSYQSIGSYAIVDQSQEFIAGYTDLDLPDQVCKPPLIIFGDHTRILKFIDFEFFIGADGVKVIQSKVEGDTKYFYHFLNSLTIENNGYSRHFKFLKRKQILVPPLPEQKRIAAILDKADELKRKREAAIAKLDQLAQSIFVEMFGDVISNDKKWLKKELFEIVINEDAQRKPVKSSDRDNRQGAYSYYGASGIIDTIDEYIFDGERLLIGEDGANLVARSSPIAFIAKGKFWVNNHAHVLAQTREATLKYLEYFFANIDLKPYVTGSAQPKLTRAALDRISVPTPPFALQEKFSIRINKLEEIKSDKMVALAKQNNLFSSLQHQAFAGHL